MLQKTINNYISVDVNGHRYVSQKQQWTHKDAYSQKWGRIQV